jgi:hypothetical protein
MPLPMGKAVVRSVLTWGDASSRSRGGFLERAIRLALPRGGRLDWSGYAVRPPPRILGA